MSQDAALKKSPIKDLGELSSPGGADLAQPEDGPPPERLDKQHRAGVASFLLALVGAGAIIHTILRVQGLRPAAGHEDGFLPGAAVYLTVILGGALVLEVVALVLGFMGTFQKKSRRSLAGAGLALSFVILASILSVPLLQ